MKRIVIAISVLLFAAIAVPAAAEQGKKKGHGPEVIQLPQGFGPEGITTTKRHTFLVGSRESGAIYKGSLRTGKGDFLVGPSADGFHATGMKVDKRGRLFVSGADSDRIRVFDVRDGGLIRNYAVDAGFINDVILTRRGAYFTDSAVGKQQLYFIPFERRGELGDLVTIPLTGELAYTPGFNVNGIEATKGGRTLILVKSNTGELFTADAATGVTKKIPITGLDGELDEGDGLLLKGRKLYVVENQDDRVTVVRLNRDLSRGLIVREIDSQLFEVPTTIARSRGRNYVVNAKFERPNPDNSFEVVRVPKK
jgi:hypothetical protein